LARNPGGTIVSEVKCSQRLYDDIAARGGNGIMWKAGHSLLKAKMRETGALLGGEMSGHIFFKERYFGFDDAVYAGADRVRDHFRTSGLAIIDVDGVRVKFPRGWGLLRASNTQPVLVMRFEAQTRAELAEYRATVEGAVQAARAALGA